MSETEVRGRFLWQELMTQEPKGAQEFYGSVIGWKPETMQVPGTDQPYTMMSTGKAPIAGMMQLPDDVKAPSHWIAYIGTPNVDDTLQQAKKLGARVYVEPMDIPTVGRMAVLADPQGAIFAIYTPTDALGAEQDPQPLEFSWYELATTDYSAAMDFYSTLFGWKKTDEMDMGPAGTYAMYGRGERTYGGMYDKPADMPAPPHWLLYVKVKDLDAAVKRVAEQGGTVLNGPMEVPGGDRIAQCMDPQGAAFALHASKAG